MEKIQESEVFEETRNSTETEKIPPPISPSSSDTLVHALRDEDDNCLKPSHYIDQAIFHNIIGGESTPCYIYYCDSDETSLPIEILQRATVHVRVQPSASDPCISKRRDSSNSTKNDSEKDGKEQMMNRPRSFNMNKTLISCKSMKPDTKVHSADLIYGTKPLPLVSEAEEIYQQRAQQTEDSSVDKYSSPISRKTLLNLVGFQKPKSNPLDPENLIQEMRERNDRIRSVMNW